MYLNRFPFVALLFFVCAGSAFAAVPSAQEWFAKAPIVFERNDGQSDRGTAYIARGLGYAFEVHPGGALIQLNAGANQSPLAMRLAGASSDAPALPAERVAAQTHYYRGSDPSQWLAAVPSYKRVVFDEVYDGIDVAYYGQGRNLEYDFILAPGADPRKIAIEFPGADAICVDDDGALIVSTATEEIRHLPPYAYQLAGADRRKVSARYSLHGGVVTFDLGDYDRNDSLVIDPEIVRHYRVPVELDGGISLFDSDLAVDSLGNVIVTGSTVHSNLPLVNEIDGPNVTHYWGNYDVVVFKYNSVGDLVYSTYLSGEGMDIAMAVAIDAAGNAYVTGTTESPDFPVSVGAWQTNTTKGSPYHTDAFVTKISPLGALVYSTLAGGEGWDRPSDIAVDSSGRAIVAGTTDSEHYPITAKHGSADGDTSSFVTKFNAAGTGVEYSIGIDQAFATAVAIDSAGAVYVTGSANEEFATTGGVLRTTITPSPGIGNDPDAFVLKLDGAGAVELASFFGGSRSENARSIAVDSAGDIYIVGETSSYDFPVTGDALDSDYGEIGNAGFYVRLDPEATYLKYATFHGEFGDIVRAVQLTSSGEAVLFGGEYLFHLLKFNTSNQLAFDQTLHGVQYDWTMAVGGGHAYVKSRDVYKIALTDDLPFWAFFGPLYSTENDRRFGFNLVYDGIDLPVTVSFNGTSVAANPASIGGGFDDLFDGTLPPLVTGVYDVTITNGSGKSFTIFDGYEEMPPAMTISGVSPSSLPAPGGTQFAIYGSGFAPDSRVGLTASDGSSLVNAFATYRVSSSELRTYARAPLEPGTYDVSVSDGIWGGGSRLPVTVHNALTVSPRPMAYELWPRLSSTQGGTTVTFLSTQPLDGSVVKFGDVPAASINRLEVVTPAHPPGRVDVTVTDGSGTTTFPDFLFVQKPDVQSFTPAEAPPEGATVTVVGSGFLPGARVTFEGLLMTDAVVVDENTIVGTAPPSGPSRPYVGVTNPDGGFVYVPVFTYIGLSARGFSPQEVSPAGETGVLYGEGFEEGVRVWIGRPSEPWTNVEATVLSVGSSVQVSLPAYPVGPVDVTVENPDGARSILRGRVRVVGESPSIVSISPSSGPMTGTSVIIDGSGFPAGTRVAIGNRFIDAVVLNANQISAQIPPSQTSGSKQITITTPDYQYATGYFYYVEPPSISSVIPAAGPSTGGTDVHVDGSRIHPDAVVTIGGVTAATLFSEPGLIVVDAPAHAPGDVDVTVTNPDGQSATETDGFRYLPDAPTLASFTPASAAPGNTVVIEGTDFFFVQSVKFHNGRFAEFTVDSPTQITATVPSQTVDGPITVTTQSGVGVSNSSFVVASTAPEITSFSPTMGDAATVVTITGLRLSAATAVRFGTLSAPFVIDSDTQITATVPANPKTGKIAVVASSGTGTSENPFIVPPRFASAPFNPSFALPGAPVIISGINFEGTTEVLFNGEPATPISVNAAGTKITATVPAAATTGFVRVTAQGGAVVSTATFTVPPQVDSFTPSTGALGDSVVITGARFTGATKVTFGGVTAAAFNIDSATQITATSSTTAKSGPICVTVSGHVGCSAASYTFPPRFATTPFSPTTGVPGTSIKINGANFQGTTAVSFNGVAQPAFSVDAAGGVITAVVPEGATTGPVSITTPVATIVSTRDFGVPAAVTSFSPGQGPEGTTVTLTGVRFTGATAVKFGGVAATVFTVVSDTAMTATVPASSKTGTICVTTPGGVGCSTTSFGATPRVTSFSPANALPGASVTINGTSFHGASAVSFNGAPAIPFTVNAAGTGITTTVPADATTGPVTVVTPVGSHISTMNFGVRPEISAFSPAEGEPGSVVTITGVRLTGATAVRFGGTTGATSSTIAVISDAELTAVVPATGKTGTICVNTPGGQGCSTGSFLMPPRVTGFSPGTVLPLAAVAINGLNFQDATAIMFSDGVAQPEFTVNAAGTSIATTVPANAITGPVSVTTPSGTHVSTAVLKVPPVVSGFTPASADVGATVTITGVRFAGATRVEFGGVNGGSATFTATDTSIEAVVPADGKNGTICVTTPGGEDCSTESFLMPPRITGFSTPNALPGVSVNINGANFQNASSVAFNGTVAAPFTVNATGTAITVSVPEGATTGFVTVTTPGGTVASATNFGVRPVVSGFTPASADVGATVTITGVRLGGTTIVKFNGSGGTSATTLTNVNDTTVSAVVPVGAKSGTICVTTAGGSNCSTSELVVAPRITSISPANALPGASVTINGANFENATTVVFNGVTQPAFTVNGIGTAVATTVPSAATTGPLTVTTPAGTATSPLAFGVMPVITGFSPSSGGPGTNVVITGSRFTGATAVKLNGVSATYTVNDASTINAIVPASATTGKISVTTAGGAATSVDSFTLGAKISSFTPNKGAPGTTIRINGSALTGATAVSFSGVPATTFTVVSATAIDVVVPAGATTGTVTVTTPTGSGTSTALFYLPASISGFTPSGAPAGTVVTINGTNFTGATAVSFNNATAVFTVVSPLQITATVPASATNGTIAVTTPFSKVTSTAVFTVLPAAAPVLGAVATSASSVTVTWSGNAAQQYDVQRSPNSGAVFSTLARVTAGAFVDNTAVANTSYLYRVLRVSDGAISNADHATAIVFTDDPFSLTPIKAMHVLELRRAVNALRSAAGHTPATWTEPALAAGMPVRLVHLTELRNALTPALNTLGRSIVYTDASPAIGSIVKRVHFEELRNAVK